MRRIDVRHQDTRGIEAVVGAVVIFILTRLWLSGDLASWLAMITGWFRGTEPQGMSSATYAIVELLTSLVYGIGAISILVWSGIAWLVKDVAAAVRMVRERGQDLPAVEIEQNAGEIIDPVVDAIETLAAAVTQINERIDAIEAKPAPKTTARRSNG
jgi:hypothetical protein